MNCVGNHPHDPFYKWSTNEYDALAYDYGNINCSVKIKPEYIGFHKNIWGSWVENRRS